MNVTDGLSLQIEGETTLSFSIIYRRKRYWLRMHRGEWLLDGANAPFIGHARMEWKKALVRALERIEEEEPQ